MRSFNPVSENPLRTREDAQEALRQLCAPLGKFYSPGSAHLEIGATGTQYSGSTASMEAFSRILWGLAPYAAGGGESDLWPVYLRGIRNGTDPTHEEYWKKHNEAQMFVEMAAISYALLLVPEKIWDPLTEAEKANVAAWLDQINHGWVADSNWIFFRVMVNVALKERGRAYDQKAMDDGLRRIEDFYLGEGWYSDGIGEQRDYYIAFAFHFYSLIYAKVMEADDPERSRSYKERAALFARDFILWFSEDGAALPFGRSLTYRFAQCGFWGALAYAGAEAFPWGVIKGILLRNLRWWFARPIFTTDGLLSVGYAYPNLIMAEGYNAPGSPYWAMKAFLPLALPSDHPFWAAAELPLPKLASVSAQRHPHMLLCRPSNSSHVFALSSGQFAPFWLAHCPEKYEKFAYSTAFGFSVPKAEYGLGQGAFDSTLALSEGDELYRVRRKCEAYDIQARAIYSRWKPWENVEIETWLIPVLPWHVRVHRIATGRRVDAAEGGFAISAEKGRTIFEPGSESPEDHAVFASYPWGFSGIVDLLGSRNGELIWPEANTNLLHPRTAIPSLTCALEPGVHWLACAVLGMPERDSGDEAWVDRPSLSMEDGSLALRYGSARELLWSAPRGGEK
jgi:hypothetical protein